jgi:hypothetical protein
MKINVVRVCLLRPRDLCPPGHAMDMLSSDVDADAVPGHFRRGSVISLPGADVLDHHRLRQLHHSQLVGNGGPVLPVSPASSVASLPAVCAADLRPRGVRPHSPRLGRPPPGYVPRGPPPWMAVSPGPRPIRPPHSPGPRGPPPRRGPPPHGHRYGRHGSNSSALMPLHYCSFKTACMKKLKLVKCRTARKCLLNPARS